MGVGAGPGGLVGMETAGLGVGLAGDAGVAAAAQAASHTLKHVNRLNSVVIRTLNTHRFPLAPIRKTWSADFPQRGPTGSPRQKPQAKACTPVIRKGS